MWTVPDADAVIGSAMPARKDVIVLGDATLLWVVHADTATADDGTHASVAHGLSDGVAMVRTFSTMVRVNWGRKLVGGADVAEKTVTALRWVKRAGSFLQWAGIIAEAALLVYTVVEGEKERDTLRK